MVTCQYSSTIIEFNRPFCLIKKQITGGYDSDLLIHFKKRAGCPKPLSLISDI